MDYQEEMMELWLWLVVVTAGAVGQFLDALAGMGFGALSSTVMVAGGLTPAIVVGTVNIAKVGSGLVSGLSHWRLGNVRKSWALPMLLPAVGGGVLAALVITSAPEQVARYIVPAALTLMGLLILRRFLSLSALLPPVRGASLDASVAITQSHRRAAWTHPRLSPAAWLGLIGLAGGLLNGISGAFGPFATSAVILKRGGHPRFAIGTVNFVEFFVAASISVTILTRLDWGSFHWALPVALMAGSIATAPLGAYLSRRLPARVIGVAVGLMLVALNLWSIARAVL